MSNSNTNLSSINTVNRLEIDWLAVRHNVLYFRAQLRPETKLLLMLKSDAYGNGDLALAKKLESENLVDYLAVFHISEGIQLREAGIQLPIMVMHNEGVDYGVFKRNQLELVVYKSSQLKSLLLEKDENIPAIHLKFNTGMNRLGIDEDELPQLIAFLKEQEGIEVKSVLTHLSSTKMEEEDAFTLNQLDQFEAIANRLKPYLPSSVKRHALNSHGIIRFPKHQYEMVRLGVGAYGGSDMNGLKDKLKPIATFKTKISSLRRLSAGSSISYDRSGRLEEDANIATIPLGYDDGIDRRLGNGNWEFEIGGKLYPSIGNVCMNLCMINLGDDTYDEGKEVLVFGGKRSIFDCANLLKTISYEIMTAVGPKVERILVND